MKRAEPVALVECTTLDALPPGSGALFEAAETADFAFGLPWYRNVLANGMEPGARPAFLVASRGGVPLAIFPMQRMRNGGVLSSLTTPYTCLHAPLIDRSLSPDAVRAVSRAFGRFCRAWPVVRMDAMAADWWAFEAFRDGVRAAGLVPLRFDHFGNWHETVAGKGWVSYRDERSGVLRETIRRKLRRAERDPDSRFEIIEGGAALEGGIAAFEAIYARSWKEPEPFPRFNAGLMREAAAKGILRLGVLFIASVPVATQLWIVEGNGRATVLKLAHDEAYKPASPGTVLSAIMLERLLDQERVTELDYGRGDDPYKRLWTRDRRQRVGVLLANPLQPRGAAAIARNGASWAARAAARLRPAPEADQNS